MISSLTQHIFFFTILAAAWVLMYFVLEPFLVPILLAVVFAVFFKGTHNRILEKTGKPNISALLTLLLVVFLIILPISVVGFLVFNEARGLYLYFSSDAGMNFVKSGVAKLQDFVGQRPFGIELDFATLDITSYARTILGWLISNTSVIVTSIFTLLIDLFVLLIALFYLLRDGKSLRSYLIKLSPLDSEDDEDVFKKVEVTINSVIKGSLIIAVLQGTLAAIGLTIFGIGNPALWGVITAIAALIPGIGTGIINFPIVIYLLVTGNFIAGIGYLVWSIIIIGLVDNILNPLLIERKVKIHPFLILISVIGGLAFFGPIGFLAGPILLAIAVELLKLYPKFVAANPVTIQSVGDGK